jgi:cytokinesis protein
MSPSIPEEREIDGASDAGGSVAGDRPGTRDGREDERPVTRGSDEMPTTPTTVVVPPSPEQQGRELPTPPPEEA